jgi:hypothetical protein
LDLLKIFDEVMRAPESARGTHVEETCRLLAEAVKSRFAPADYKSTLLRLRDLYFDQFIHTCSADPTFAPRIEKGIQLYL